MYSNNPQSAYNGMMSGHRNMFLLSSVGIAMVGFLKDHLYMKMAAIFIFIFAGFIGIQASLDFAYYLKENDIPRGYRYKNYNVWPIVGFTYGIFLIVLSLFEMVTRVF